MFFKVKEKHFRIFKLHLGKGRCSAWLNLTNRFDFIRAAVVLKGVMALKRNLTLCPGTVTSRAGKTYPWSYKLQLVKKFKFILKEGV